MTHLVQDEHGLRDFIVNPYRDWSARYPGRRAFGYLCTYAPFEVLHAAGLTPVRLMQASAAVTLADAHLPSFSCALARTLTERMLAGELDFLAGVLFSHTCDTLQCLADIWRMAKPRFQVVNFSLPTVLNSSAAQTYVLAELQRLAAILESEFGAPVTENALRASIALYNEQRRLLAALYERAGQLAAEELWALTLVGMLIPVEEHNALLRSLFQGEGITESQQGLLRHAERRETSLPHVTEILHFAQNDKGEGAQNGGRHGPALILVGPVLDDPLIPQLIDELGGRVVGDDLCTGSRYFDMLVDETKEPFVALAERYVRRAACPAKHVAEDSRTQRLLALVRDTRAQGVVFVQLKFCDPHAFDYVPLSAALADAGVPHLLLETDVTTPIGQLRTRLQAFLEMMRSSTTNP